MVTTRIELDQVAGHRPELVAEAGAGAEIAITKGDQPVARLAGYVKPRFGSVKGMIATTEDFDQPLEGSEAYRRCDCSSIRSLSATSLWETRR